MNEPPPDESDDPDPRRATLIGMGAILLLIVISLFLIHMLRKTSQMQDCVMSGRTNCAPIDATSSGDHAAN